MTRHEEEYIHFVSCIRSLNNAWRILQEIKNSKSQAIIESAAFRFALIEYSKPFKISRGTVLDPSNKSHKHCLDQRHIPIKHVQLHNRIIGARDQIHAHEDLTVREAKLYVKNTQAGKIVTISQNIIYGTEEISNIDEIIEMIEQTLDVMYEEEKGLQQQLLPNS